MRERKYLCKFDKWLSEKLDEDTWSSITLELAGVGICYTLMYFGPEISFYTNGYVTPPRRHMFTMMWVSALCLIILIFTTLKIIRLIRKKSNK